jgi:hypothetical protein
MVVKAVHWRSDPSPPATLLRSFSSIFARISQHWSGLNLHLLSRPAIHWFKDEVINLEPTVRQCDACSGVSHISRDGERWAWSSCRTNVNIERKRPLEEAVIMPLLPQRISSAVTRDWSRVSAVGRHCLSTWAVGTTWQWSTTISIPPVDEHILMMFEKKVLTKIIRVL